MSVFLIVIASSRVFPFTHSLATELEAMAEPQPNVLNFASTIFPLATLIYNQTIPLARNLELHHITTSRSPCNSCSNVVVIGIKRTYKELQPMSVTYQHYGDVRSDRSQDRDRIEKNTLGNEQQMLT